MKKEAKFAIGDIVQSGKHKGRRIIQAVLPALDSFVYLPSHEWFEDWSKEQIEVAQTTSNQMWWNEKDMIRTDWHIATPDWAPSIGDTYFLPALVTGKKGLEASSTKHKRVPNSKHYLNSNKDGLVCETEEEAVLKAVTMLRGMGR